MTGPGSELRLVRNMYMLKSRASRAGELKTPTSACEGWYENAFAAPTRNEPAMRAGTPGK